MTTKGREHLPRIAIIGGGFVGRATHLLCGASAIIYDLRPELCVPEDCRWEDVLERDIVLVCVPTPMDSTTGECHTAIVSSVLERLRGSSFRGEIILRSTVPIGYAEAHECHFFPEFLTEKHWARDIYECPRWILGIRPTVPRRAPLVTQWLAVLRDALGHDRITSTAVSIVTPTEAEAIKLFRNTFLATKIAFCNEWYTFCTSKDIDYERVRGLATLDARIGQSHTQVPGHDDRPGFGGTCLPKDLASTIHQFHEVPCPVLRAVQRRNDEMDRPARDWALDKGRSVVG